MGKLNATKYCGSPLCTRNKEVLAMSSNNHRKIYIIENKVVNLIRMKR
jgi:hypothetical protein